MGQFHSDFSINTFTMKFLVLSACLAVSSAAPSFFGLVAHPNGAVVPVDEPAVAAARADHLAAKGVVAHAAYGHAAVPAVAHAAVPAAVHVGYTGGYTGPLNLNTHLVAHPNGAVVPADEPAVAAARADHLAAKGVVAYAPAAAPAAYAPVTPVAAAHGVAHLGLVAHPNGAVVPVDEPAVAAARAAHFAALAHGH